MSENSGPFVHKITNHKKEKYDNQIDISKCNLNPKGLAIKTIIMLSTTICKT